ncbi:MAG: SusC/RagA family TonB-linked outer membrane protein [Bacteroides sp.]|nr:SusC/RagA family TonB-linked outer membrane protein [Bacteroides sp.]
MENLSILKGASASALYGSEAANGVVMITTKSGRSTKGFGVDVSASLTADFVAYMPEYQTTFGPGVATNSRSNYKSYNNINNAGWADGWYAREDRNGVVQNSILTATAQFGPRYDGSDILYYDGTIRPYKSYGSNPWKDIFRTGTNQQYNVAITNGTEKSNLRLSYTYTDNLPTQYNSTYKKHNFNLTGSYNISKALKVDYTVNYIIQDIKNRPYRISRLTNNFAGMFSAFDDIDYIRKSAITSLGYANLARTSSNHLTPNEGYEWDLAVKALVFHEGDNEPGYFWNVYRKEQLETNNRLIASVTPSWTIIDGLVLRGRIATDYTTEKIEKNEGTEKPNIFGTYSGYYGLTNRRYQTVFGEVMLSYNKDLTEKINLNANAGWTGRTESTYNNTVGTDGGLTVENWFHINASARNKEAKMLKQEFLKTAWLGTVSLSYDNWAYLEGTARQEKISTLAKGNNSFFYPSVNASIIYTELMKDNKPIWFDYGKVRMSYGIVGNAPAIYKATQAYTQNTAGGYIYNTVDTEVGNETIKPEKKFEWEFGLESKFFGNRLGFDVSFYTNKIKDQILNTTIPGSVGGRSILMNVGELQNSGFELSLYGTPIRTRDWNWELRTNFSWYKNKVTKLADGIDKLEHWNLDNGSAFMYSIVGRPMGDIYSYAPATDENGNKIVTAEGFYKLTDDVVKVGNALPKFIGGFATTISYKDFFLDASFDYRIGGAVMNTPYQYLMSRGSLKESMANRDAAHGGLTYYLDEKNNYIPFVGSAGPNGEKVYDNGMILPGVKEDGTTNDIMIGSDYWYGSVYGWGGNSSQGKRYYAESVFDNTYVKVRELSLGYNLPAKLLSKFACRSLQISVYGRNLFYIYKKMPAFDAEATDATNWIGQTQLGGSTATTRSFGVSLRASF